MTKLQPLKLWAKARFDPPPLPRTLIRWATSGMIHPMPQKIGKMYWVDPRAELVRDSRLVDRIRRVA